MEPETLEFEIEAALAKSGRNSSLKIELAPGNDVTGLSAKVDVFASYGSVRKRLMSVLTADCVARFVSPRGGPAGPWTLYEDMVVTGAPLIVVRAIRGDGWSEE